MSIWVHGWCCLPRRGRLGEGGEWNQAIFVWVPLSLKRLLDRLKVERSGRQADSGVQHQRSGQARDKNEPLARELVFKSRRLDGMP